MENKLEQLLNSLVEAGWKPRGLLNEIEYIHAFNDVNQGWRVEISYGDHGYYKALRQIVSRESGLWQFVCENHLYIYKMGENKNFIQDHFKNEYNECCYQYLYDKSCYEYYLLESSLKDESELEDFLLSNIKTDE